MEEDTLIAEAEIGEEARKFVESDLGKVLIGMAEQEVQKALEELELVDPEDKKKITALQNQAKAGRNFQSWLAELVDRGNAALLIWRERNGTEG